MSDKHNDLKALAELMKGKNPEDLAKFVNEGFSQRKAHEEDVKQMPQTDPEAVKRNRIYMSEEKADDPMDGVLFEKLKALGFQINLTAIEKGFWADKDKRNKGEAVMLMVSELSEALEAHRKDHHFGYHFDYGEQERMYVQDIMHNNQAKSLYEIYVKDTLEAELAGVVLRVLDFTYGFHIPVVFRNFRKEPSGNFGHDLLRITNYMIKAFHTDSDIDWGYVLASIIALCRWNDIDIVKHVEWELGYFKTRPAKHGKKY